MPVTILDIAKASGKSYPTVSRALNNHPKISAETTARIKKIASEMGYRPSFAGRMLQSGKTNIIGVIVAQLTNPVYAKFASAIKERALLESYDTVVYDFELNPELERIYLDKMLTRCCDGLITSLSSFEHTGDIFSKLWETRIPCVIFGPPLNDTGIKYDAILGKVPSTSALGHLIDYGHRKIIVATGFLPEELLGVRIKGYFDEFKKHGLEFVPENNLRCSAMTSGCLAEDGWLCGKKIFSKPLNATAIVCVNDYFAFGVMRAALDAGLKIPDDISIVGSDNIWVSKYSPIPLTTIDQNLDKVAEKALNLIFKRLKNKDWQTPERITVQGKLIIRESTRKLKK